MKRKTIASVLSRRLMENMRVVCVSVLLTIAGFSTAFANTSEWTAVGTKWSVKEFSSHIYVATGLGVSHLNPDTSEVVTDVNDRVNAAGQVTLGVDFNKWFSLEVHSADLGSAGLSPEGRINYHVHGTSGLFYIGRDRRKHVRRGLSLYGRVGVGYLENSPVGNVRFERDNPVHMLFGAGLEFTNSYGIGARAEVFSFDNDAFYTQLALMYRFGGRHQSAPKLLAAKESWAPIESKPAVVPPVPAVAVVNPDTDGDGVLNELDQCPATAENISVNADGCALFNGVADGVNFYSNSARLTQQAKEKLDTIAALLLKHQAVNAKISAHTDNWGEENYNQVLSGIRAAKVVGYLSSKGIERGRMLAQAFGETLPIDTNDTADGRTRNRRVEIVVQKELR